MTEMASMRQGSCALVLLLVVLCSGLALPAHAAQEIGSVIGIEGDAWAGSGQEETRLDLAGPIHFGDTVHTGAGGKVQILFNDQTILALGPDSRITVDQYVYNPASPEDDVFGMGFDSGAFRMITGGIAQNNPEQFSIHSPLATIGIRGTSLYGLRNPATNEESYGAFDLSGDHTLEITHNLSGEHETVSEDYSGLRLGADGLGDVQSLPEEQRENIRQQTTITSTSASRGHPEVGGDEAAQTSDDGTAGDDTTGDETTVDGTADDGAEEEQAAADQGDSGTDLASDPILSGDAPGAGSTTDMVQDAAVADNAADYTVAPSGNSYVFDHVMAAMQPVVDLAGSFVRPENMPYATYQLMSDEYKLWESGIYGDPDHLETTGFDSFTPAEIDYLKISPSGTWTAPPFSTQPIVYTQLGEYADGDTYMQWGYWRTSYSFMCGGTAYELSPIYDVRGDVNDAVDASLSGHYTGATSGYYAADWSGYIGPTSGSGSFSCDIDVLGGSVTNFNMSCDYGSAGVLTATGGSGGLSGGHYDIGGLTVVMPQGGPFSTGTQLLQGAIFGPGATGGTFAFQNQDSGGAPTSWEAAVGEFHGQN